mmetsp:Transcript_25336/g.49495  ORF Transcript_25336/g.49495 Transcript_25336/m.49495 type:complete len:169 (-) Transcript_25336:75-581(-)
MGMETVDKRRTRRRTGLRVRKEKEGERTPSLSLLLSPLVLISVRSMDRSSPSPAEKKKAKLPSIVSPARPLRAQQPSLLARRFCLMAASSDEEQMKDNRTRENEAVRQPENRTERPPNLIALPLYALSRLSVEPCYGGPAGISLEGAATDRARRRLAVLARNACVSFN